MQKSAAIDLAQKFQQARQLHQRHELAKAQSLYKYILRFSPKHFEALYYLGVSHLQIGEPEPAVALIEKAATINPNSPEIFSDLGYAFNLLKRHEKAVACYNKAINLNKNFSEAYNNRGIVLSELEKWEEALADFDRAIALKSNYPEAYTNRGAAFKALGRSEDALASHDKAIALNPFFAEAYNNKGLVFKDIDKAELAIANFLKSIEFRPNYAAAYLNLGKTFFNLKRYDDAIASFNKAIKIRPDFVEAFCYLGHVYQASKRHDDALKSYQKTIELDPKHAEGYNGRGNALKKQKNHAEALESFEKAIALKPDYPEAFNNRAIELQFLNRLEDALASYDKAIEINPEYAEAYSNRGGVLKDLNRLGEALASLDRSIELKPDYAEGLWSRGQIRLLQGDYETGLQDYEWRKKSPLGPQNPIPDTLHLTPDIDINNKKIFIYPELYLGDAIQFSRYVKLAEDRGAHVTMSVSENLHKLLGTISSKTQFLPKGTAPEQFDYCCSLMSLPFAFKTGLETIPTPIPYLKAEPDRVTKWGDKIGKRDFRIGICWQGSTQAYSILLRRSFPLALFNNISRIPNVRLISLQKSDGIEQLATRPEGMKVETLGDDFDAGPDAFVDTAAVMENLDLVITSDTAIAHLAGALGRPTWVILRDIPDWRWHLNRSDSPWYPNMKLFRQSRRDDWNDVFHQIEFELRRYLNASK